MKNKKNRNILLLVIISVLCWVVLSRITTTGLSNPITFYEMQWGIDKAAIAWIITLFSMVPAVIVIFIMQLRKNFCPAHW